MAYLVRKIARGKWSDFSSLEELSADVITADLRTQNNTLSVWKIDDESKLDDAILALATSKNVTEIDKMYVVIISEKSLSDMNFSIKNTEKGDTVVEELADTHRDVEGLKYPTLGKFATVILEQLQHEREILKTKKDIENILKNAIYAKRLDTTKLSDKLREKISRLLS
jgi:hypothetical protein